MRKWMKYITAAFIGINCLFTSCQLYEQVEEYFFGDDNASETESEDEGSIRLVVSNSSSCKVRISLGSSTEYSSEERQFLCEIKPSYQLQKTVSIKNTVLFYEYYFDDSMCPLVKKVDISTSGKEFKFNITEIDFSETMNAAVLVFSNNTGGEIDVRNSNMVVQSEDGNETICSGTSSVYRIEESGAVNYFNYGCFYVYTAEENFSFSNITFEKNLVYFFAVREDGLVLLKEYSFNSYAKNKAGISVDSEIENLGKEEMPFLLVNNRYEAKISLHNRGSVSSTMLYVSLVPDEGLVIEGDGSKGFFLNPMKENSAYTFPLTVSCNSEFGSGYEVKKIHMVVSDTKPTQTVFLEQDIEFVFFKGMSLWNLSVYSPLGTSNGKVDVSVGNTLFNIGFSVENNKTKQIYLPSVENDVAFIRLEASKSSEQWCYSISKNETRAPENGGDSAFQSICFQEPQNDSKNTAQNFGTSMQGYLSENDVDFYRIDLNDDTEIYYEKGLKLHLKDSMVKVYIKTAEYKYSGIELYSLGNYPSFIQVKYGAVLEDCLKNEFGSDGYKRIGWYFYGWYMNIDKKIKLDTSMLVTEEMTVYPVYY